MSRNEKYDFSYQSENQIYQLPVSLDYPLGLSLQSLTKYLRLP